MSYEMYRHYGRGLGSGLGPNLSPYCRRYPELPRGWWANPAYSSQTATPQPQLTSIWPTYQAPSNQYPYPVAYDQTSAFPPALPRQAPPMMMPQSNTAMQQPYGSGSGMGIGAGRGMGMQYRHGRSRFGRNSYQY